MVEPVIFHVDFLLLKVPQPSTFLGSSIEKAVEVLDTVGSSIATLNSNSGFMSTTGSKGNKISILAFEVANTTVKGSNLLQSLSEENVQLLKKEIFRSEGVKQLVSTDINELLRIAASDKRFVPVNRILLEQESELNWIRIHEEWKFDTHKCCF